MKIGLHDEEELESQRNLYLSFVDVIEREHVF